MLYINILIILIRIIIVVVGVVIVIIISLFVPHSLIGHRQRSSSLACLWLLSPPHSPLHSKSSTKIIPLLYHSPLCPCVFLCSFLQLGGSHLSAILRSPERLHSP